MSRIELCSVYMPNKKQWRTTALLYLDTKVYSAGAEGPNEHSSLRSTLWNLLANAHADSLDEECDEADELDEWIHRTAVDDIRNATFRFRQTAVRRVLPHQEIDTRSFV